MKEDSLTKEIRQWVVDVKNLHEQRAKDDLNLLFDINPVMIFELQFLKNTTDEEKVKQGFLHTFEKFCQRVVDAATYEAQGSKISEKFDSISKMLHMMDVGFGIYSTILSEFDKELIKKRLGESRTIYDAFNLIDNKRRAIFGIIDPFDGAYSDIESQIETVEDAYKFIFNKIRSQYLDWEEARVEFDPNAKPTGSITCHLRYGQSSENTPVSLDYETGYAFSLLDGLLIKEGSVDWEKLVINYQKDGQYSTEFVEIKGEGQEDKALGRVN